MSALKLAACLERTVEELFGVSFGTRETIEWAWAPQTPSTRLWRAEVGGRLFSFPVEETVAGEVPHDGVAPGHSDGLMPDASPVRTLIAAGCDPAAGLLASEYARQSGFRMIVFGRSSQAGLELLKQGRVHVVGVHLSAAGARHGNAEIVRREFSEPVGLLRLASWEEGVALGRGQTSPTLSAALRGRLAWIGREPGSGARQCLDELVGRRKRVALIARDHRGVANALRDGWAGAGVCVRLVSEEAGLSFFSVRAENYDLIFLKSMEADSRIQALIKAVRSTAFRRMLGDLPGYDVMETGGLEWTSAPSRRSISRPCST
jgi:molybdate-binding protein